MTLLSITDSHRKAVSSATGFRTQMNELHGREIVEQEQRIQALLIEWQGQDPATISQAYLALFQKKHRLHE